MAKQTTVGNYLVHRLTEAGVGHVFGVPGDYVLSLYDLLKASPMQIVGTCTEIVAGYAADAYARVNGLGAACITYCVGGLNILNAVAGAYAEKSPVIVISGAPGLNERIRSPLLHHRVRNFDTQLRIFEQVTVMAAAMEDASTAPALIDEAIATCVSSKLPVYLELPRDMVHQPCAAPVALRHEKNSSDANSLAEAIQEAATMLRQAKRPVILAGVEIHRFGVQKALLALLERSGYPVAATLLGKSVITERHEQYLGVYEGAMGQAKVQQVVEKADCALILGAFMMDINLGIDTANLDPARTIYAYSGRVAIKYHPYKDIFLSHFVESLTKANLGPRRVVKPKAVSSSKAFKTQARRQITVKRFFARINEFLDNDTVVICDIGDSLFGAADLTIHRRTEFISPAYYTSMGFAVPATIGAQIRNPNLRPIVFVGDGAFQMTGQELSTIVKYNLNPIIFVLNNKGYTTERFIHKGDYNEINDWEYHIVPQVMGAGWGCQVKTEGELEAALNQAKANTSSFSLLNVAIDPADCSAALLRLGKRLGKKITWPSPAGIERNCEAIKRNVCS
jgi:indolepyruvate decarboxylase